MPLAQGLNSKILLVDDDPTYTQALSTILGRAGYEVQATDNGRSAASLVGLNPYDLVLSDLRMPGVSGLQLFHVIRKMQAKLPVVLMTGYTQEMNEFEASKIGVAGFLQKPFNSNALLSLMKRLTAPEVKITAMDPENFCQIAIDEFISGKRMEIDLFVKIGGDNNFVKIANSGEDLSLERLKSYRRNNLQYFYVSRSDYEKYVNMQVRLVDAAVETPISLERKMRLLRHANEVILGQIRLNGVEPHSFSHARHITEANLSIISKSDSLHEIFSSLQSSSDHVFAHSLGVSIVSSMIAREMGWNSPSTLYKISLGGLLHNVGLKSVPKAILDKPIRNHTPEELGLYQRHPIYGLEILRSLPNIPTEVLQISLQHHEARNGYGYPGGLRDNAIFPLAKIVAVASDFCDLTIKSPGVEPKTPLEAIAFMREFRTAFLHVKMIESLEKKFKNQEKEEGRKGS